MFPMTITINNPDQLSAVIAALNVESSKEEVITTKKGTPKPGIKQDSEPQVVVTAEQKPEALAQMTAGEAAKAPHGHANRPVEEPTYQETADAVIKLTREKGREAAVAVLAKFGATKLPDVKPEQFAGIIAACEVAGG